MLGKMKVIIELYIQVKCPVRNYAKNKIIWTKDGKKITNNGKL